MARISRFAALVLLVGGGLLAGLLLGEVGLRLTAPCVSPALRAMVTEEGYRGGQSALRVVQGITRILHAEDFQHRQDVVVVGDSMAFGWMVGEEDVFTTRLAEQTRLSVLNLGITGAAPCVYNRMLQMALARLPAPPSTVVYTLFANDITDPACDLPTELFVWDAASRGWKSRLRAARERLFLHSVFYQVLKRMISFGHLSASMDEYVPVHFRDSRLELLFAPAPWWRSMLDLGLAEVRAGFEETLAKIQSARLMTERGGSTFVLVLMPCKEQVYLPFLTAQGLLPRDTYPPFYDDIYDQMRRRAEAIGIATIDLRPALREDARKGTQLFWTLDGHLTPTGHQVTARAVEHYLARQKGNSHVAPQK